MLGSFTEAENVEGHQSWGKMGSSVLNVEFEDILRYPRRDQIDRSTCGSGHNRKSGLEMLCKLHTGKCVT